MAPNTKRAKLLAEISKLQHEQSESLADATFVGWTSELEAAQKTRADHIARLLLELNALDETP